MRKVIIILILIWANFTYSLTNTVTKTIKQSKIPKDEKIKEVEELKMINTLIEKVKKAKKNGVENKFIEKLIQLFKQDIIDIHFSNELLNKAEKDKKNGKSLNKLIEKLNVLLKKGIKKNKLKKYLKKEFQNMNKQIIKDKEAIKNNNQKKERVSIHQLQLQEHKKMKADKKNKTNRKNDHGDKK